MRYDRLLENKTVWITGCATRPYDAYARLFSAHGARIVLIDANRGDGEALCAELRQGGGDRGNGCGGGAEYFHCDLHDSAAIEALCDSLLRPAPCDSLLLPAANQPGSAVSTAPDVYLHVADEYGAAYIDELKYSDLESMMAVSVVTPYTIASRIAAPMAAKGGGSIVIVSGHYGVQAMNRVSGYGAAKGGQIALARALAAQFETQGSNIRVNAVVPGVSFPPVGEDILAQSGEADTPDFWGTVQTFRRRGQVGELANAALFLASGMASNVNGEALYVNGAEHLIAHNHYFPTKQIAEQL